MDATVLALERAAALLGDAMAGIGDRFAIRAFCSNGRFDVRYGAIKELAERGIDVFCAGLGAGGGFTRVFGHANVMQIDRIERLPEKLPLIYLRLTA